MAKRIYKVLVFMLISISVIIVRVIVVAAVIITAAVASVFRLPMAIDVAAMHLIARI